MSIVIRNQEEINKIREACKLAQSVLVYLEDYVKEGISTLEINDLAHNFIVNKLNCIPAPLNYNGFPKSICTSRNEVVCHGIPNKNEILKNGDIINIDVTVIKNGYYGDTSKTFLIGDVSEKTIKLCNITQKCLYEAIKIVKPGAKFSDIGALIQKMANSEGFSVVVEYAGHGIGSEFHCEPIISHTRNHDHRIMKPGMVFTIEPMINAGTSKVKLMRDNWTVKTNDNNNSAQYEHQILVTETGCEILTIRDEEINNGLSRIY